MILVTSGEYSAYGVIMIADNTKEEVEAAVAKVHEMDAAQQERLVVESKKRGVNALWDVCSKAYPADKSGHAAWKAAFDAARDAAGGLIIMRDELMKLLKPVSFKEMKID